MSTCSTGKSGSCGSHIFAPGIPELQSIIERSAAHKQKESKDCDIGIAGGDGKCVIFKKGEVYKTVDMACAEEEFLKEIDLLLNEN